MKHPDLEKLRRFALAVGLVLITYYSALVQPDSPVTFGIFGVNFKIMNPRYIPIGLILASIYGAIRFGYYGMLLTRMPFQIRKQLCAKRIDNTDEYQITIEIEDKEKGLRDLKSVFPRIERGNKKVSYGEGERVPGRVFGVIQFEANTKTRILAWIQDIDYAAPVWLNGIALFIAITRFCAS